VSTQPERTEDEIAAVIDTTAEALRTQGEVPPILSEEHYETYKRTQEEIRSRLLPEQSDPRYEEAFLAYAQSSEGILDTALGARMIEWLDKTGD
jgi:hypothetical protein